MELIFNVYVAKNTNRRLEITRGQLILKDFCSIHPLFSKIHIRIFTLLGLLDFQIAEYKSLGMGEEDEK